MITRQTRTYVYIDITNLLKNTGNINYTALMSHLNRKYRTTTNLLVAKAFLPIYDDAPRSTARIKLISALSVNGFEVIRSTSYKDTKNSYYKDDTDIVMAVTIMDDLRDESIQKFVIMSGDKDFVSVIEKIIHEGRSIEVYGPLKATCADYRKMKSFTAVESIPGIIVSNEINYYQNARIGYL